MFNYFNGDLKLSYPRHLLSILVAIFIFVAIPLTVFLVVTVQDQRSKAATPTIDITSEAVQTVHQTAVPHTDINGNFKSKFDTNSFFPIGIYNPTLCRVIQNLSWKAQPGFTGDYRIQVNYGGSRSAGTYILANIDVGNVTSASVGNLPPNSVLYYSIWLNNTSTVIDENQFTSGSCAVSDAAEDQNFQKITLAGFNTALLEKNYYPDNNVLSQAQSANLKLILDMRDQPSNTFTNLKDNPNVFGFYTGDDALAQVKVSGGDPTAVYNNLKTYSDSLDSQTSKIVLEAEPDILTSDPNNAPWLTWYNQFDAIGNVSFHYNYPVLTGGVNTIQGVADTVNHQVLINGDKRPSWFIDQAINLRWLLNLDFPTAQQNRAMAYTALIHGATGLFQFSYDGWYQRQPKGNVPLANQNNINYYDRHAGIKSNTPTSYPGGDKGAYSVSATDQMASINLWNGIDASQNGLNKELNSLKPVILSNTATDTYKVLVDQRPVYNVPFTTQTISPAPIQTLLKKYMGDYYLLAVNVDNATINSSFIFTGKNFALASVLFENRNASLTGGSLITDSFAPFATHVYKLTPNFANTISNLVASQKQVCSLLGANQRNAGIGGQDGGTSLQIGSESFWTFGDTTNSTGGLFLPNSIARTSDLVASDCVNLTSKTSGVTAQSLLNQVPDELLVWPDGMVDTQNGYGHFFYMSVRSCKSPEPCTFAPTGGWKVRGIGLAKFDTTTLTGNRVGNCTPITNCLFWQEIDQNGFDVAGATAVADSGYVYVFLNESPDGVNQVAARLARVPVSQIENKAAYQYWNGSAWVANLKDSVRVMSFDSGFNGVSVAYNSFLGKWTAIYTTNDFSAVAMRTSPTITGPWSTTDEILVNCRAVFPGTTGLPCYFGRQHPEYAKNSGQTIYVSYSNQQNYQTYVHEIQFTSPTYVYWVHVAGQFDNSCCASNNPTSPTTSTSKTFNLQVDPDPRGYTGVVCSPDCSGKVIWSGQVQFYPNGPGGVLILTPTGQNPDNDRDGFSNAVEQYIGTNPNFACGLDAWPPDFDNDGVVSILDLARLAQHYNTKVGDTNYDRRFDLNADGSINILDLSLFSSYYLRSCG